MHPSCAHLVSPIAELLHELCAGRTLGLAVAVVVDRVAAGVAPGARLVTGRPGGAARHGRVQHGAAALAVQLLKT